MTEPITDSGRQTRVVPLNGRQIVVRELVDTQMVHLMRHSRILQKSDVPNDAKMDSVDRIFKILKTMVVQPEDQAYLVDKEEAGEISLRDLMAFINAFKDEDREPEKPKVRRGRPPAKRA